MSFFKCGLWQSCSFPSSFTLRMNLLTKVLSKFILSKFIQPVALGTCRINVFYIMLVDDVFIFCRANLSNCLGILRALELFYSVISLSINLQKSKVTFSRSTPLLSKNECLFLLNMKETNHNEKYLRCLLFVDSWRNSFYLLHDYF